MNIYPCGTTVKTKIGSINGMITCCSIRFDKANYEITYFVNMEQKTMWMSEQEFETSGTKTPIGYK